MAKGCKIEIEGKFEIMDETRQSAMQKKVHQTVGVPKEHPLKTSP